MHRLIVCYGQPTDPAEFDRHYAEVHGPLATKLPGLVAYTGGHPATLDKSPAPYYYVAELDFATEADFKAALASPEMAEAAADVPTFASGGATMFGQELHDFLA